MAKLHDTYTLQITTRTPLHIGTGITLLRDYDYVVDRGHTYVLNTDTLAAALYDQAHDQFERMAQGAKASELIAQAELHDGSPFVRYVLGGEPRSDAQGVQLQEQIKNIRGQPYLPGSALKGAIRTALVWNGWHERGIPFGLHDLNDRGGPKTAAQPMERRMLVAATAPPNRLPNYDLLRAIQVSDSTPIETPMEVLNVGVVRGQRYDPPIELEGVPAGTTFTATLTLDGFLRKPRYAQKLGWDGAMQHWLTEIPARINAFTRTRLIEELKRWQGNPAAKAILSFYATLQQEYYTQRIDEARQFYLQVGWGGGWDSKTFGDVLTADAATFYQVVQRYQNQMDRKRHYRQGDRYPKTRRLRMESTAQSEIPALPLGWLRIDMEG